MQNNAQRLKEKALLLILKSKKKIIYYCQSFHIHTFQNSVPLFNLFLTEVNFITLIIFKLTTNKKGISMTEIYLKVFNK